MTFAGSGTAPVNTVNLDAARTVGGVVFNNANSYVLAAGTGGSLVLNAGASLNAINGSHSITAPITDRKSVV